MKKAIVEYGTKKFYCKLYELPSIVVPTVGLTHRTETNIFMSYYWKDLTLDAVVSFDMIDAHPNSAIISCIREDGIVYAKWEILGITRIDKKDETIIISYDTAILTL